MANLHSSLSFLVLLLAATTYSSQATVIDSCPTQQPAFTAKGISLADPSQEALRVSLNGLELDDEIILEFPIQTAMDLVIESSSPMSELFVRLGRFDGSDASNDIDLPLSSLCEPPAAGVLFESPSTVAKAVLQVQDPGAILILDVTLLLHDSTSFLYKVFVVEFVGGDGPRNNTATAADLATYSHQKAPEQDLVVPPIVANGAELLKSSSSSAPPPPTVVKSPLVVVPSSKKGMHGKMRKKGMKGNMIRRGRRGV